MNEMDKVEKYLQEHYKGSDGNYYKETINGKVVKHLRLSINNQTIQIFAYWKLDDEFDRDSYVELKNQHYSYLQTYPHLPRGLADKNGYYQRSTSGEVIRYIDNLSNEIWMEELREEKLKQILDE